MEPALKQETSLADMVTPDAFETFYRSRLAPTVRQLTLITGSVAVAEDVAHQSFIEVYRRWSTIRSPAAYLRRVSLNTAYAQMRKRRREVASGELPITRATRAGADETGFDHLWPVLASLSDRQRAALVLRYYEDCTEREIADALGCRPGTVGPLITRGLAHLRKELDP